MKIEQIYTGCLSQGAYYIESNGEAAVIDPLREVAPYIEKAEKNNASIIYIFETHFHADFVSGHVTLAKETGATIVYGPQAKTEFDALIAKDQQEFKIGAISLTVLHTPGHTMESTTYLLRDANNKDIAIFSGDTLFLGDVGRPDLAQKAANLTQEDLAEILYESLRKKIMPLADDVLVYPAHGAGSACGKNLSKETVGTLGEQKKTNYALRADMTKEDFIKEVTNELLPPPQYFPLNVKMNKEGIDGGFAPWVGAMVGNVAQNILLVTPEGREEETVTRLARVGFDNTLGFLKGGIEAWKNADKQVDFIEGIDADGLKELIEKSEIEIFDVRKPGEYISEHITEAHSTPLDFINDHMSVFPSNNSFYIHCAGGYRSMIAASILKSRGIHNLIDVKGGFGKIKESGIKVSDYVCPSTL